jgi:hypothetical protein
MSKKDLVFGIAASTSPMRESNRESKDVLGIEPIEERDLVEHLVLAFAEAQQHPNGSQQGQRLDQLLSLHAFEDAASQVRST